METGCRIEKQIRRDSSPEPNPISPFESLSEEVLYLILDLLDSNPLDRKSFSLVSRTFYKVESRHCRCLTPLRSDFVPSILTRYNSISHLNLALCSRLTDASLASIASLLGSSLRSINLSGCVSYSHQGIEYLVEKCLNLEEIDVSNRVEFGDDVAVTIGKMGKLERVSLGRCKKVTDLGIGCIAAGCPNLKLFCLKGCVGVTDFGIGLVAVKCRKLKSFDVSFTMITRKSIPAIMQLPCLEKFCMIGCLGILSKALVDLKQGCSSLEALDMSNCPCVTSNEVLSALHKFPNLHHLSLAYCSSVYNISMLPVLNTTCELNSIKLDGCKITTVGLRSISNSCISLKELSLSKCLGLTDEGISVIVAKHKDLVKLDVTCCKNITDLSLAAISRSCTSLVSLRMESCTKVTCEGFQLIGRHCPKLEELDLTDNDLDDEGLRSLAGCSELVSLKIGICQKISDEGLIHIGQSCSHLQELDLYRSIGITDRSVSEIAHGCPNLEMINMGYCTNISDESLRSLSKCAKLNTLEIRSCFRVSSVGISAIATGCRQLSKLDIKKCCEVNDTAMFSLARYSHNLRRMHLSYCSVTDAGLLALMCLSCLRSVSMFHLSGVSPKGLVAAVLMSSGVMKVKVDASFKQCIPEALIEHIETRGCSLRWSYKPFQIEPEPSELWKKQSLE